MSLIAFMFLLILELAHERNSTLAFTFKSLVNVFVVRLNTQTETKQSHVLVLHVTYKLKSHETIKAST